MSINDHESDCSSYSYCPDFKTFIDNSNELFFIRLHPIHAEQSNKVPALQNENVSRNQMSFRNEYKRMSLRKDRGKLLNKLGDKKSRYQILKKNAYQHSNGVLKELKIGLTSKAGKLPKKPISNQKRENIFETIFNASLIMGPDKRFLLDKINEGSVLSKDLIVGDYIKSIDGEIITSENINSVLKRIQNQSSFKIVAYESSKDELESSQEEMKITKPIEMIANKSQLFHLDQESHELVFSLNLVVKNDYVSDDDFTSVFSFPPKENNFLQKLKGSFLTISSILNSSFGPPTLSMLQVHDTNFYITYTVNKEKHFIFLGFNSNYTRLFDVHQHTSNIVKFFDFVYPDFVAINDYSNLITFCEMIKVQLLKRSSDVVNFEQLFSSSSYVPLPKEIVLRINDSLSELEAMDYRNWNETLMELFGKFNVCGSCLFYKSSLVCSHFSDNEMENVELFLRNSCIKLLYENCLVREIAIIQRVYPKQYQSYNMENDSTKSKVFLLVAGHGNLMMCVMVEENGYNINPDTETQSSKYLINFLEEIDDLLDHLKIVGIENLTRIWINSAKRPQCKSFVDSPSDSQEMGLKTLKEEDDESEHDFDSQIGSQKSSSGFDMNDFSDTIYKDLTEIIPQVSVTISCLFYNLLHNSNFSYFRLSLLDHKMLFTISLSLISRKSSILQRSTSETLTMFWLTSSGADALKFTTCFRKLSGSILCSLKRTARFLISQHR